MDVDPNEWFSSGDESFGLLSCRVSIFTTFGNGSVEYRLDFEFFRCNVVSWIDAGSVLGTLSVLVAAYASISTFTSNRRRMTSSGKTTETESVEGSETMKKERKKIMHF